MANKLNQANKLFRLRAASVAVASCLALAGIPFTAQAAGLGKIIVFSALGQPLRAEIEVSATREELVDMRAQLASQEAFEHAGLDYATSLLGIRFSLDKKAGGKSVIKLSSDQPINDPFVDMLLEINWPAGRLVREYTFLLDPADVPVKAAVPVVLAQAKQAPAGKSVAPTAKVASSATIDDATRVKAVAKVAEGKESKGADKQPAAKTTAEASDTQHQVRAGETLRKIAADTKYDGVSLEQMLVALLQANQSAFDGGNMNRLKSGKILNVPDKQTAEAVSPAEAKKIIVAQSSDWNAYRDRLAGVAEKAPVSDDQAKQQTEGKITAKVEDKSAPAIEPKDQLKVSKTKSSSGQSGQAKLSEEDVIARDKALKEANDRVAFLQDQVAKMEKLLELKNKSLADLEKQAATKAADAAAAKTQEPVAPPAVAADKPVEAKTEPVPDKQPEQAVPPVADASAPKPEEKQRADEVKAADEKPVEQVTEQPAKQPEKPKVAAQPVEEPGFLDGVLEDPMMLGGIGAAILVAIGGLVYARRRRAADVEKPLNLGSTLTPPNSLTGNSVFRSTGGQSVDTSHTPAQTDFSQAGPGSIDTDEVDPVAEADVYMAYGRDAQAEEILLEAKHKDPKRLAIHLKLLEIYANRKDAKQFETLATDLYSETGGVGADWEKAATMGKRLDANNPLYGGGQAQGNAGFDADATVIVTPAAPTGTKSTVTLPGELAQMAAEVSVPSPAVLPAMVEVASPTESTSELASLDFDLGLGEDKAVETTPMPLKSAPAVDTTPQDFQFTAARTIANPTAADVAAETSMIDFDLATLGNSGNAAVPAADAPVELDFDLGGTSAEAAPAAAAEDDGVEFDVSLTESTFLGRSMPDASGFDMSGIDLDLKPKAGQSSVAFAQAESSPSMPSEFEDVQVSTAVNSDFAREQTVTMISPAMAPEPMADLLPAQDFSMAQAETQLTAGMMPDVIDSAAHEATVVNPSYGADDADLVPEFEVSSNEEAATKLDLAKAYEEMGDFEGASELLQEVLNEGDSAQKEKARAILAKIGA